MSIGTRVIVAVAFQKVDHAPYSEARAKSGYKYLQCCDC